MIKHKTFHACGGVLIINIYVCVGGFKPPRKMYNIILLILVVIRFLQLKKKTKACGFFTIHKIIVHSLTNKLLWIGGVIFLKKLIWSLNFFLYIIEPFKTQISTQLHVSFGGRVELKNKGSKWKYE